jgi:hypothetical protein
MNKQVQELIGYALSQVGVAETPKGSNKNKFAVMIDTQFPDFYNGKKNGYAAWCDIYVDACFLTCFGEEETLRLLCQPKKSCGAGCKFSAGYFKNKKQFDNNASVGDQIFFFDSKGEINHTGIVYKVEDGYVYTVEGNSGDEVKTHRYATSNKKIAGYGHPDWKEEAETIADTAPTKPIPVGDPVAIDPKPIQKPQNAVILSEEEIALQVINGMWGNGKERKQRLTEAGYDYDAIQKAVNKKLGVSSKPAPVVTEPAVKKPDTFIGIVNTVKDRLNVRTGAGMNYPVIKTLGKGSKVELYKKMVNGWYRLADGSGYVAGNLIKK